MIKCPKCQYISYYSGKKCSICGEDIIITQIDIDNARLVVSGAAHSGDKEDLYSSHRLLADIGEIDSQREYARYLESTDSEENMDLAMRYYYMAAEGNDPRSAFHYSILAERTSDIAASFWLRYSAVLGYAEGFTRVGEQMLKAGMTDIAAYYFSEAASCDDTDAIVTMAKLYYEGKGVPASEAHAKWYLDKLSIPPIHAIRLAYRLRNVKSEDPPRIEFPDYSKYLRNLAAEAKNYGFMSAYFHLIKMLADRFDENATVTLGTLIFEGVGCKKNVSEAVSVLDNCIMHGNAAAALYLANEYRDGKYTERNIPLALDYYTRAAKLGYTAAYELMGDLYREGKLIDFDIARAIDLYELAGASGNHTARHKASELKAARRSYFDKGSAIIGSSGAVTVKDAEEAFRSLAISTAMGYPASHRLLAKCYANGFGTSLDRERAFYWYSKAVELSDEASRLPLALCYLRGFGTRLSYKKAIPLLKELAEEGDEIARNELFALYEKRMRKMIRSIYSQAMSLIHMKKFTEALALLHGSEELGYPKALYTLGAMYEFGLGTKSDRHKASAYYTLAARGSDRFGAFTDPHADYKSVILKMIR